MEKAHGQETRQRVAIVTGAGRGVGRAVAIALARAGFALCLAARTREELEHTRTLCGLAPARSLIVLLDLAQEEAPECLIDTAFDHFGPVDVLVNNAGWAPARTPLVKLSAADQDRILAINLRAPIALARLAAKRMASQEHAGVIVNVASSAARRMPSGEAIYAAAKAGLIAFTHAAFAELRDRGIKLSVVIPGLIDTSLIPHNKRLDRRLMLRPEDVAAAVISIINAPAGVCPVELVLEPQRDPLRGGQ
ncbi:MAG: SDR family oxidoreductase [Candidatus Binataceae bacterium]|jgi:NAD(P)-dependent dehydrogenase (short-subunit alcohol dehydrogenase family)